MLFMCPYIADDGRNRTTHASRLHPDISSVYTRTVSAE
jgi:hypothetical protein